MNDTETIHDPRTAARGDGPAQRNCLCCKSPFASEGFGERVCKRCKAHTSWRSGISSGDGGSRRKSSR